MSIATLLLWMAMQGMNLVPDANGNITAQSVTFAPAQHIIEIKTKREEIKERVIIGTVGSLQPDYGVVATPCKSNQFLLLEHGQFYCARHRVTREIWIDGVKWGVLKGD